MSDSVTSRNKARQASLSFTVSQNSLKFMSIKSVMLSNHLILCHPLLLLPSIFPSIRWPKYWSFSQLHWAGSLHQVAKVLVSALASILPMTIQDWSPSEWTGWISLQSKGLSRVFSNITVQSHTIAHFKILNIWKASKLIWHI